MAISKEARELIKAYGEKYLSAGDVRSFLDVCYSHARRDSIFDEIKKVLTMSRIEIPSDYEPTFIYDGKNACPEHAKKAIIAQGITKIRNDVFGSRHNLLSITIPNSVTEIGLSAFQSCSSLASINIPNGTAKIGDCAFADCKQLISVLIPDSVTEIGKDIFLFCSSLKEVKTTNPVAVEYLENNYPTIKIIN